MTERMTSTTVTFQRPFVLDGFESLQDAGSYVVDTYEEQIDSISINAWQRVSTVMRVMRAGLTEHVPVDPEQLREALMRDGAQTGVPREHAKARHDRARGVLFRNR